MSRPFSKLHRQRGQLRLSDLGPRRRGANPSKFGCEMLPEKSRDQYLREGACGADMGALRGPGRSIQPDFRAAFRCRLTAGQGTLNP